MFLIPGFSLLILGVAGLFANGYVASVALLEPGGGARVARLFLDYMRDADQVGQPAAESKGKQDDPRSAYAAVMGTAMGVAQQEEVDRERAEAASGWMGPFHVVFAAVSVLMIGGGIAILRGRWYWLGMLGSVAAIVNLGLFCCVPGLVAGLWGVLTLARDEGRRHFFR